jgi:hypothetical protein
MPSRNPGAIFSFAKSSGTAVNVPADPFEAEPDEPPEDWPEPDIELPMEGACCANAVETAKSIRAANENLIGIALVTT